MLSFLLTLLAILLIVTAAFWWVRRGYRFENRLKRESEYAREMLANCSRQLMADLHSALAKKQLSEPSDLELISGAVQLATDKQDGTLYALIPFKAIKTDQSKAETYRYILLARWQIGKWRGTPIVELDCSLKEAFDRHSESLKPE